MEPEGIRKVIAEQSLEGAIISLAEQIEQGVGDASHEQNSLLYTLQGKLEQLEDRVNKLEGLPLALPKDEPKGEGD